MFRRSGTMATLVTQVPQRVSEVIVDEISILLKCNRVGLYVAHKGNFTVRAGSARQAMRRKR